MGEYGADSALLYTALSAMPRFPFPSHAQQSPAMPEDFSSPPVFVPYQ